MKKLLPVAQSDVHSSPRNDSSGIVVTSSCPAPLAPLAPLVALPRRSLLKAGTLLCLVGVEHLAWGQTSQRHVPQSASKGGQNGIVAVRIWPAPEYSRVTIESDEELKTTHDFAPNPPRLFVDIENLRLGAELRNMETKVQPDDPNIASIRIAQNSPNVVRMVFDLKQQVRPEIFTLKPIAPYRHRLVFDLYPLNAIDPMAQLIEERMQSIAQAPSTPDTPIVPPPASTGTGDPLGEWINQQQPKPPSPPLPPPPAATPSQPPAASPTPAPRPAPPAPIPSPSPTTNPFDGQPPMGSGTPSTPSAPAPQPSAPRPSPSPAPATSRGKQTDRIYIVALDPGHGGEDPGAIGPGKTFEKNVVLPIALQVRNRINSTRINGIPIQAFMTRDRDFFVPLANRVERARRVQADLFVSIHADAAANRTANGASVYALSQRGATSAAAALLAEQENKADAVGGLNIHSNDKQVQNTLADMSTSAQIRDSLLLGQYMRTELAKHTRIRGNKVEQANFAVLRNPDTPSILVETGFISNPDEERLLRTAAHQAKLADAIAAAIVVYLQKHPPQPRVRSI